MKGICILAVVFTHFRWNEHYRLLLGFPFEIDMAVPVFMLISGYVYALSYQRHNVNTFADAYDKCRILKSFIRYTTPFLLIFLLECFVHIVAHIIRPNHQIPDILYGLFTGGWGPGSYYYPLLIQLIFLYPVLYFIIKKYNTLGLFYALIANAGWEFFKFYMDVSPAVYRLLIFRYILLISAGIFAYLYPNVLKRGQGIIFATIGIIFIIYTKYLGNQISFLEQWTGTCFVAAMYIIPIFYFIINKKLLLKNRLINMIISCGKASYNIFLVQMIFYTFGAGIVYRYIQCNIFQLIICVIVPSVMGYIFFKKEDSYTKGVIKRII